MAVIVGTHIPVNPVQQGTTDNMSVDLSKEGFIRALEDIERSCSPETVKIMDKVMVSVMRLAEDESSQKETIENLQESIRIKDETIDDLEMRTITEEEVKEIYMEGWHDCENSDILGDDGGDDEAWERSESKEKYETL